MTAMNFEVGVALELMRTHGSAVCSAAHVEVRALVGEPLVMMRRAARDWGATLVIAPAQVHARFIRSLRTPAERLVHDSDVPVLVLPAENES